MGLWIVRFSRSSFSFSNRKGERERGRRTRKNLVAPGLRHNVGADAGNHGGRQETAERHGWHDQRTFAQDGAGLEHGVAPNLSVIAKDGAKFSQASIDVGIRQTHSDRFLIETKIGQNNTRTEMRAVPQNRVAYIA